MNPLYTYNPRRIRVDSASLLLLRVVKAKGENPEKSEHQQQKNTDLFFVALRRMCCCCPPPVRALFNLWFRSGCSKSTVAAALTFFPPSPTLYSFQRFSKEGELLTNDGENDHDLNLEEGDDTPNLDESRNNSTDDNDDMSELKNTNPLEELSKKNSILFERAKKRYERDVKDAENGVTYKFIPDERLREVPSFSGTIECIKIHNPYCKSYIATMIYKLPDSEETNNDRKTIVYSHGNATDLGAMHLIQCLLARGLGVNVVMYDYSGYGESGGVARENNTCKDLEFVYTYAVEYLGGGKPENIILYGQSVGSGPSCYVASRKPVGGLILHSPFMSGMRVLTPSRALACLDIYPNIDRIKRVKCPVFILHGMLDEEVEVTHGIGLYEAVREEFRYDPWWIPDRGHNDICEGAGKMSEYIRKISAFLTAIENDECNLEKPKSTMKMKR